MGGLSARLTGRAFRKVKIDRGAFYAAWGGWKSTPYRLKDVRNLPAFAIFDPGSLRNKQPPPLTEGDPYRNSLPGTVGMLQDSFKADSAGHSNSQIGPIDWRS